MKYKILLIFLALLIIPLVNAQESIGTFKQNDCTNLIQTCSDCTFNNISSISYPNSTIAISDVSMIKIGKNYYYDFCNATEIGDYIVTGYGDDSAGKNWVYKFYISSSGRTPPSGSVIIFFSIAYLIVLATTALIILYSFGHCIKVDFDIIDLAYNYGIYFAMLGLSIVHNSYLGDSAISNFLTWTVNIGIFTNLILPTIYFILTLTIGSWQAKQVKGVDF